MAPSEGAAVVIVKFNDYQCPPCGMTFREYKPVLEKWQKQAPGKIEFVTQGLPARPRVQLAVCPTACTRGCEAAVSVRLAREKGKAEAMEGWLFANQPSMTPDQRQAGGARGRRGHRLRVALRDDPRAGEGRHRPGRAS